MSLSIKARYLVLFALLLNACTNAYERFSGKDVREVVRTLDDDQHMIVWPRDEDKIYSNCTTIDYVTILPKENPNHSIVVRTDGNCKVISVKEEERKGL